MEIITNSIRNIFLGTTVMVVNFPLLWSLDGVIDLIQGAAKFIRIII